MTYSKIQFIALSVDTNVLRHSGGVGLGEARSPARLFQYSGEVDPNLDFDRQFSLFVEAVRRARNVHDLDHSPDVLKVIMAPEFFFRSASGAYPLAVASQILEELRKEFCGDEWRDWLFIPGTVMTYIENRDFRFGRRREMLNVALYQKGGHLEADSTHCGIICKEYLALDDCLRIRKATFQESPGLEAVMDGEVWTVYPTQGSRDYGGGVCCSLCEEGNNLSGGAVFTMDGIRFGLEVCLDHQNERLLGALFLNHRKKMQPIHVQLVPSLGMCVVPTSIATVNRGLIFNVDGRRNDEVGGHCSLYRSTPDSILNGTLQPIVPLSHFPIDMQDAQVLIYPVKTLPSIPDATLQSSSRCTIS